MGQVLTHRTHRATYKLLVSSSLESTPNWAQEIEKEQHQASGGSEQPASDQRHWLLPHKLARDRSDFKELQAVCAAQGKTAQTP